MDNGWGGGGGHPPLLAWISIPRAELHPPLWKGLDTPWLFCPWENFSHCKIPLKAWFWTYIVHPLWKFQEKYSWTCSNQVIPMGQGGLPQISGWVGLEIFQSAIYIISSKFCICDPILSHNVTPMGLWSNHFHSYDLNFPDKSSNSEKENKSKMGHNLCCCWEETVI